MELGLAGKTAIVTGSGSGIGAAIAAHLGAEGANVVLCDINLDAAEERARGDPRGWWQGAGGENRRGQ